ncbi:MAG: hypothetical protein ACO3CR_08350, partial [Solirubrobacterales bacterium]
MAFAIVGFAVFFALLVPPTSEAATSVQIATSSQKELLKAGGLKVRLFGQGKVRVSATGKGKSSYFKSKAFSVRGSKTVSVPLSGAGFGALGYCKSIPVQVKAAGATASRTLKGGSCVSVNLGPNPTKCDFLDTTVCLQPFANDYFTRKDSKTTTGRRLDIPSAATPANTAGDHVSTTDINRADGFSPGNLISLKVPGLDTPKAFGKNKMVPLTDLGSYSKRDRAVIVLDAKTGKRHPIWTEIDANPTAVDPSSKGPGGIDQNPSNTKPVNLIIRPAKNFEHGRRYIVVLRNLKNAGGRTIGAPKA